MAQDVLDSSLSLTLAPVFEKRNLDLFNRICNDSAFRLRIHRLVIKDWHHDALDVVDGKWPWLDGDYFSSTYKTPHATWQGTAEQVRALVDCLRLLKLSSFS